MTLSAFVDIDTLKKDGACPHADVHAKLFLELADDRLFRRLAKFNAAAQRSNTLDATRIGSDLGREQFARSPMEAKRLDANVGRWPPSGHALRIGAQNDRHNENFAAIGQKRMKVTTRERPFGRAVPQVGRDITEASTRAKAG